MAATEEAGYYSISAPAELGGAAMGMLAYFVAWERIYRPCGSHNWLGTYTVSHWAFGPSSIPLMVTERARAEILTGNAKRVRLATQQLNRPGFVGGSNS
jgi:acyl-CoA dehydrogenase